MNVTFLRWLVPNSGTVAGFLILTFLGMRFCPACEICNAVLTGGVFNDEQILIDQDAKQALIDYLADSHYEEVQKAIEWGLSLKAIIKAVPVGLDMTFDKKDFERVQEKAVQLRTNSSNSTAHIRIMRRFASSEVLDSWLKCVQTLHGHRQGLTWRFDRPEALHIVFMVSWIPDPQHPQDKPRVLSLSVKGGQADPTTGFKAGEELVLGIDNNVMDVERHCGEELRITLRTDKGDVTGWLPSLKQECPACRGAGTVKCARCKGEGYLSVKGGPEFIVEDCTRCRGKAFIVCNKCNGDGKRQD